MEPLFGLSVFYVLLDVLVLWNGKVLALCFGYICFVVVVVVLFVFLFFFCIFMPCFKYYKRQKQCFSFISSILVAPDVTFPL